MHAKRALKDMPGNFLHFLFSEVAFSAFSGKNSAQNLINYIKFLTAIINSYQSCSNSNDPLNILHKCCDTNLSFNYMSTKKGGGGGPDPLDPHPGSAPATTCSTRMRKPRQHIVWSRFSCISPKPNPCTPVHSHGNIVAYHIQTSSTWLSAVKFSV